MAATKDDISRWFDDGVRRKATHMIVVSDAYDHEDYPVYVDMGKDAREVALPYTRGENMQRLMEVYHLGSDKDVQLAQVRAHNYDPLPVKLKSLAGGKKKGRKAKLGKLFSNVKKAIGRSTFTVLDGGKKT